MSKMRAFSTLLPLILASGIAHAAVSATVVDLPTRGYNQRFLYLKPDVPVANLIALPGNDGVLGIQADGSMATVTGTCFPVARTRDMFTARGFAIAFVDAPSDNGGGLSQSFRMSPQHVADVLEVIRYLQQRADVPIWIIGGSASSTSIANLAINLPSDVPLGAIFFSNISVNQLNLGLIRAPTLVVNHAGDFPELGAALVSNLTRAQVAEQVVLTGGGGPCAGYHLFEGLEAQFVDAVTDFVAKYNPTPVVTPPATTPDPNQHGLTGSWYEAATSGQGIEVEVYANPSSGTGSVFLSWFTYDTVMGGAERQRWYTAQGQVVTGQPNASLTIYQNTGGNFNAPPVTNAQAVGTATLRFDTCSSGQLTYNFTDGTGRTGTIALKRLMQNVTCSTTTARPTNADFARSGNWYGGAATSGQGFTAEVNPISATFFAAWYTYIPNGSSAGAAGQRWYTAQGTFTSGMRSIPVTIYQTSGGVFDTPTPTGQNTVVVGTGTMAFQSCSAATFSYNFTGGSSSGSSGSIVLSRVGPVPPGCTP